jgi:hypothetical protein
LTLLHKALFYWPEAIHVIFHFLTYWLAKKQFLCNKRAYCTLVQNQWMKLRGRVKYGEKLMFGFKNNLFTIKIMKGEHLYIYNRL